MTKDGTQGAVWSAVGGSAGVSARVGAADGGKASGGPTVASRWVDMTGPVTIDTGQPPKRWSDDPWCNMTTGEADAWRKGWEAARKAASEKVEDTRWDTWGKPRRPRSAEIDVLAQAIAAMEPKS